jgi:hypothetical protein
MSTDALPFLRSRALGMRAWCSQCGGLAFDTNRGRGEVYSWRGIGARATLGGPDGDVLDPPVTCVACGRQHAAAVDFSPPLSSMTGDH